MLQSGCWLPAPSCVLRPPFHFCFKIPKLGGLKGRGGRERHQGRRRRCQQEAQGVGTVMLSAFCRCLCLRVLICTRVRQVVWGLPRVWVREGPCVGQEPGGSESAGCGQDLCGRQPGSLPSSDGPCPPSWLRNEDGAPRSSAEVGATSHLSCIPASSTPGPAQTQTGRPGCCLCLFPDT